MNLIEVVDVLCEGIEAGQQGCEVAIEGDDVRIVRTFYGGVTRRGEYWITDIIRAVTAPDWKVAITELDQTLEELGVRPDVPDYTKLAAQQRSLLDKIDAADQADKLIELQRAREKRLSWYEGKWGELA